jgi:hypothetical protein
MIGQAIGQALPFAVGVALSPVPIIAVVLMLSTPKGSVNGPAFLTGLDAGSDARIVDDVPVVVEADVSLERAGSKENQAVPERLVVLLGSTDLERRHVDPSHDVVARGPAPEQTVTQDRQGVEQGGPAEVEEVGVSELDFERALPHELERQRLRRQPVTQLIGSPELRPLGGQLIAVPFDVRDLHPGRAVADPCER